MAKKQKEVELPDDGLKFSFAEFINHKKMEEPTLVRLLDDVFRTLIRKKYGADDNFDVIVDYVGGTLEIWRKREIVPQGEVEDERYQIDFPTASTLEKDSEMGEDYYDGIPVPSFGRRAIMAARQTLVTRMMELEKDEIHKTYANKIGALIIGEVSQVLKKELMIIDDQTGLELMLPKTEMIRSDFYRKGDMVKAVVKTVEIKNGSPLVLLSRIDEMLLYRLLEQEVPEIEDGLITIKKIVRRPGERAKVAVESYDETRIDPVGSCVGVKGSRIHGIVRELRNENIDVVNYSDTPTKFVERSLTPAKITTIEFNEERQRISVFLPADEVSKAIGKRGINIDLAAALTGFEIDVFRDDYDPSDDVELDEFRDEIEPWIIEQLKNIGCKTAREVLRMSVDEIAQRADLEDETVTYIMQVLQNELNR
jgi:transcription termination/antitermination protein NusA